MTKLQLAKQAFEKAAFYQKLATLNFDAGMELVRQDQQEILGDFAGALTKKKETAFGFVQN